MTDEYSPLHPHEPGLPPVFDDEGRCLVCCRLEEAFEAGQEMRYREDVGEGIVIGQEEWMLRYYSLLEDVVSFHLLRISSEEFFSRHPDIPRLDSGRS
jgi:hypothetical protein